MLAIGEELLEPPELDVDDAARGSSFDERLEDDDVVDAVQELGAEKRA